MSTIAITNVHVFDGTKLSKLKTICIENGVISSRTIGDTLIDGEGGTLLPGFIDSHIHLSSLENLKQATSFGVTTMLDMATKYSKLVDSLRGLSGLTDIISCYHPASAAGGIQTERMGFPGSSIVNGPNDAERFVDEQVTLGADYIKIILEDPAIMGTAALTPDTAAALVKAAHRFNKRVFAHVTTPDAFKIAIDAGVDVLAHVPLGASLSDSLVEAIAEKGLITVPTMVMMKGIAQNFSHMPTHPVVDYHNIEITVEAFNKAGIPIVAGTDSNDEPGSFCIVKHGESLHEELELLVGAGMSPVQALQSATSLPAKLFGFEDRGVIETGKRADLVLVDGDPTVDIKATRAIQGVWIAGVRVR